MSQAIGIDHVGIVTRDLGALAAAFEAAGFTLTPLARHAGGRTGNRCVMLDGSYLELMAVMPGGASATLDGMLARHEGAHVLAFAVDDPAAAHARLARAGVTAAAPALSERAADDADPAGPKVRVTVVMPPDQPEGRVLLVRQETPAALWQPRYLGHPNRAARLLAVEITSPVPAETAARLSRLAGRAVVPEGDGLALDLPRGRVRILPGAEARISGVTIATTGGGDTVTIGGLRLVLVPASLKPASTLTVMAGPVPATHAPADGQRGCGNGEDGRNGQAWAG